MQQFCYTSCRAGQSVTGADGWQVRAISDGITEQQVRAHESLFRYAHDAQKHVPSPVGPTKLV